MHRPDYNGVRVLVMGLGLNGGGAGVAKFLAGRGAHVTVTDLRDENTLRPSLNTLHDIDINFVLGEHRKEDFGKADLVIRNPAVPLDSPYLQEARMAGVPIEMETGLFFNEFPRSQIIGVTGTRGKSTTAAFIQHSLASSGTQVHLAGNMRVSAVALLDTIPDNDFVVLELSSWQLEGLRQHEISPSVAVVTNLLPDHLDRYRDIHDYASAKRIIVQHQEQNDLAVLNKGNAFTMSFASHTEARVEFFSEQDIIPSWDKAQVRGSHNRGNLAAAMPVLTHFGLSLAQIRESVESFQGLPYRQQVIREANGVIYINDTTSTSPDAAIAALNTCNPPLVWIAGGADKGLSFTNLAAAVNSLKDDIKAIILLPGDGTDSLQPLLPHDKVHTVETMHEAVSLANCLSSPSDTILLSPACASFNSYNNEFHRGKQFDKAVNAI